MIYLFLFKTTDVKREIVPTNRFLSNLQASYQVISTFVLVSIAWIFFRSPDISFAVNFIQHILIDVRNHPTQFLQIPQNKMIFIYIIPFVFYEWMIRRDPRYIILPKNAILRTLAYIAFGLLVFLNIGKNDLSFIYFQF